MTVAAFVLQTLLPLVLRYLPDVARALSAKVDDLDEPTADIVRRELRAEGESGTLLRHLKSERVELAPEYDYDNLPESD